MHASRIDTVRFSFPHVGAENIAAHGFFLVLQRGRKGYTEPLNVRIWNARGIATNVGLLRYHQKAECFLIQRDRSEGHQDRLQRVHYKGTYAFRLFPLPRITYKRSSRQPQICPCLSNSEWIWKNITAHSITRSVTDQQHFS